MADPIKGIVDSARKLVTHLHRGNMNSPLFGLEVGKLSIKLREAIAVYDAAQAQPAHRPVGIAGERDPDHPCEEFAPGSPDPGRCLGDGHYLCNECRHYSPDEITND